MSNQKAAKKRAVAGSKTPGVALRAKIDRLDQQLVKLMNERAKVALEIGKLKDANGISAYAPARRTEVLNRVAAMNKGPLAERCRAGRFSRTDQRLAFAGEAVCAIAYLGPAYSYSHLAAIHRFGQSVELVPVGTIAAVFEEVNRGQADFGLVPIENSTDGRVADTLDMFTRLPVRICGEVQLRIHHNAAGQVPPLGSEGGLQQAAGAVAVPQLAGQASADGPHGRGDQHVDGRPIGPGEARRRGHRQPAGGHSIWPGRAGGRHRGQPRQFDAVRRDRRSAAPRTGNDKTAMMFEIAHQPGSAGRRHDDFQTQPLEHDLDRIVSDSRPEGGYLFFVEMEGHEADIRVRKAIRALERKTIRLEVLGSYAKLAPVE